MINNININMNKAMLEIFLEDCKNGICIETENEHGTLTSKTLNKFSYKYEVMDNCDCNSMNGNGIEVVNFIVKDTNKYEEIALKLFNLNKYKLTEYDGFVKLEIDNIDSNFIAYICKLD